MSELFESANSVTVTVTLPELAVIILGVTEVGIKNAEALMNVDLTPEMRDLLTDADKSLDKLYRNLVDVFDIGVL